MKLLLLLLLAMPVLGVLACWRAGRLRAGRLVTRCALFGVGQRRYQRLAARFADDLVHGSRRYRHQALRVLRGELRRGARVIVVSGCEEYLLRAQLAGLGIEGVEVVASTLRRGWFGMHVDWHNVGAAKVARLASLGIAPPWQWAFTDAWADLPLLAGACEPVLVNATPKLCKRMETALGRTVKRAAWH